ncbi:MAG: superoxide dismutase [Deltaproteobacteria bacterium]|nr:superoxide dismutase [Deltaproteobacteria bacterium]MBI3386579.1 superoxide dismutase [Deltaproteobacteria bacterium]
MTRHTLPPLSYGYGALEPWIDEQTMRIHHGQHHAQLVNTLNDTESRLEAARDNGDLLLVQLLCERAAMLTSAHQLHRLYWSIMGPDQSGQPSDELADQLSEDFGSFAAFKWQFSAAAMNLEPGGWVVLVWQLANRRLAILTAEDHLLARDWESAAVLALDAWEHAYYLKYEHRRAEYVHNWWNTVNWRRVSEHFAAASSSRPLTRPAGARQRNHHTAQTAAAAESSDSADRDVVRAGVRHAC